MRLALLLLTTSLLGACDDAPTSVPLPDASVQGAAPTGPLFDAMVVDAARAEPDAGARDAGSALPADASALPTDVGSLPSDAGVGPVAHDASSEADAGVFGGADATTEPAFAGCASAAFCADFETEAQRALSGAWALKTPNCSGDGEARVDDRVAHGGARSLRVQSGGGTCNHVFATPAVDLRSVGAALWVRFYVRFESALNDAHVTFLALADQVTHKALRMGGQNGILMWNRESDDATLPELSPVGVGLSVAPAPGEFHCVEFRLDGGAGMLETYFEGKLVSGLVVDRDKTQDVDRQWLQSGPWTADVTEIGFGWESYGTVPMTLWFDDIVIAAQRIGC